MDSWSDANSDDPPGSGYLIDAVLLRCGIAVLVLTLASFHAHEPPSGNEGWSCVQVIRRLRFPRTPHG